MQHECGARIVMMVMMVVVVVMVMMMVVVALSPVYAVGQSSKGSLRRRQRPVVDATGTGDMNSSVP